MKIAITRPIPAQGLELLKDYEIVQHDDKVMSEDELGEFIRGCEIVISLLTDPLTDKVMEMAGPQLKAICQYTVGFDNIDVEAAKRRGIIVTNTPGSISAPAVAEHAIALMFAVGRHMFPAQEYVEDGKYTQWDPNIFLGTDFMGKTVGIIGTGQIGSVFAGICHNGLKMQVIYQDVVKNERLEKDTGATLVSLEQLLIESDVISLHVPLLPQTRHLISKEQFHLMKPSAILINTSRGPVIDELELVKILQERKIFGAGIDVFENEPILTPGLVELENIIVTPHIASATEKTRIGMAEAVAKNALAIIKGETPPNPVIK